MRIAGFRVPKWARKPQPPKPNYLTFRQLADAWAPETLYSADALLDLIVKAMRGGEFVRDGESQVGIILRYPHPLYGSYRFSWSTAYRKQEVQAANFGLSGGEVLFLTPEELQKRPYGDGCFDDAAVYLHSQAITKPDFLAWCRRRGYKRPRFWR